MYKPLLKWVGGKNQIINEIFNYFPKDINNYYEPFIGGGSVFLKLLEQIENKEISIKGKITLNDKNTKLITLYNVIKNDHEKLLKKLHEINNIINDTEEVIYKKRTKFKILSDEEIQKDKKKIYKSNIVYINKNINLIELKKYGKSWIYYYFRYLFNTLDINTNKIYISSLFIYLNKSCFRGLYREGKNGFNVPYGNYKKINIINEKKINHFNELFNKYNIIFTNNSFDKIKYCFQNNDFFYFDPPYIKINNTSFTSYNTDGFDNNKNDKLIKLCDKLNDNNIKFVQSNSYCDNIYNFYKKYKIDTIECRRAINSKKPNDKCNEVIIYN